MQRSPILIVAHDRSLRADLAHELKAAGHAVELAEGPAHARRIGFKGIDLAVVAPERLGPGGRDFVSELEARMPTLLWTSASGLSRSEQAMALLTRIAAAMRPPEEPEPGPSLRFADCILDVAAHSLTKGRDRDPAHPRRVQPVAGIRATCWTCAEPRSVAARSGRAISRRVRPQHRYAGLAAAAKN